MRRYSWIKGRRCIMGNFGRVNYGLGDVKWMTSWDTEMHAVTETSRSIILTNYRNYFIHSWLPSYQATYIFWQWWNQRKISIIHQSSAYSNICILSQHWLSTISKNNNNIFIIFFIISYLNNNMNIRNITFIFIQNIINSGSLWQALRPVLSWVKDLCLKL